MTARIVAQRILTAEGHASPRVPPLDDLALLAREYLSLTEGAPTLGRAGVLYVSHAAAASYARDEGIELEEARRELTELLADARQNESDPSQWRFRRRSEGLDITCRVAPDGRLLVVTSVHARSINVGGRGGKR